MNSFYFKTSTMFFKYLTLIHNTTFKWTWSEPVSFYPAPPPKQQQQQILKVHVLGVLAAVQHLTEKWF